MRVWAVRAAEEATAAGAHREAAAQYSRALRFADGLPPEERASLLDRRSAAEYLTDDQVGDFHVVPCTVCGGILKPDVVFFGEFVPTPVFRQAASLVHGADVLLVAGSSLVVNSGVRLLEIARRRRVPIIVINRGITKGDGRATVKLDAGATETLTAMAEALVA